MSARLLVLTAMLLLSSCEAPPVFPGADRRQNARPARVEGQVVVSSTARGNVVLTLFDAERLPPPAGTGRPLTFAVVPQSVAFAGAADGSVGPFTAPFAFSLVNPGRYQVRAFIDANGDWVPWYGVTNEVNAGDVGGAAVDGTTRLPVVLEVPGLDDGEPKGLVGVPVSIADSSRVPVDRPVFEVSLPGSTEPVTEATLGAAPLVLTLTPRAIDDGGVQQAQPVFLARFADENGDGVPDDANADGVADLAWPRVVVRKLADDAANPLTDENDLDRNGVLDETGVDYEHASMAADGKPDLVVLAAGLNPTELAPLLFDSMGKVKPTASPVPRLTLVVRPLALDATNSRAPVPLKALPPGRYAITVIQQTGQTWRVPNELQPALSKRFGLPEVVSQGFVLKVGAR